jgi:2-dehydro-3-deoxygluconokinase
VKNQQYDVVCLGETMIRLTPPDRSRIEQAWSMECHVGGSESNTAVGLARLGRSVAWLSCLTDNSLGHKIERELRAQRVDTDWLAWTPKHRVGLYFYEQAQHPRTSRVIYDRADSAFCHWGPDELPKDFFQVDRARWYHTTGISLALGQAASDTVHQFVDYAKGHNARVSFDVNYRAKLGSAEQARSGCDWLFRESDLVFASHRDVIHLWGFGAKDDPESTMRAVLDYRKGKASVITLGSAGAIAGYDIPHESGSHTRSIELQTIEPVNDPLGRLGGGDAFSAGFLHSWLDRHDLQRALRWGTAMGLLKYTIPGDMPLVEASEVERLANCIAASSSLDR